MFFIIIGLSLIYLSSYKKSATKIYKTKTIILKTKSREKILLLLNVDKIKFSKIGKREFKAQIEKYAPSNLFENIKINILMQFLIFSGIKRLDYFSEDLVGMKFVIDYFDKKKT